MTLMPTPEGVQLVLVTVNVPLAEIVRTVIHPRASLRSLQTNEVMDKIKEALALGGDELVALPQSLDVEPLLAPASQPFAPTVIRQTPALLAVTAARLPERKIGDRPWLIAGVAGLAAAVGTAAVGAYFGAQYLSAPRTPPATMTQIEYAARIARANQHLTIANGMLIGGGALAALGVAAILGDVIWGERTNVGVTTNGSGVAVAVSGSY